MLEQRKYTGTAALLSMLLGLFLFGTAVGQEINYEVREQAASPAVKLQLTNLRRNIETKKLTFKIGYTTALDRPLNQLTGDIIPTNMRSIAQQANKTALELIKIDNNARAEFIKINPGKIPNIQLNCIAGLSSWDWRKHGKVTPVKNQGGCGSCWAFGVIGALESNYLIRNSATTDESEQFILANSGAGSCAGGNRASANAYLVSNGTATESTVPYLGTNGPANPGVTTPYDAVATGFVNDAVEIPSVAELKQALCEYGPLSVSVNATSLFQGYTGGVFNEGANSTTNHAVVLIGWDDSKNAWLIKNSWGTGWGETGGYGTERGYMWIAYGSNNVGRWAQWIRAKSTFYKLPAHYYQMVPKIGPIIKVGPIVRPIN